MKKTHIIASMCNKACYVCIINIPDASGHTCCHVDHTFCQEQRSNCLLLILNLVYKDSDTQSIQNYGFISAYITIQNSTIYNVMKHSGIIEILKQYSSIKALKTYYVQ